MMLKLFRRLLDFGIVVYMILLPVILITGGFKISILGISIRANHLYTPVNVLIPLILIRLLITVEFKNFLLILVSTSTCLVFMETAIRIWNPPFAHPGMARIHRASKIFSWEHVPGSFGIGRLGETYHINTAGFRGAEQSVKKPMGIKRIVTVGDSFTFGMSVNQEDAYSFQMERILNQKQKGYELINRGVMGYNMWQHYEMLKKHAIPYQPDLVVLEIYIDDILYSIPPYNSPDDWEGENPFEPKDAETGILSHSYLFHLLNNWNSLFETKYRYRRGYRYLKGIKERKEELGPANPENIYHRIMYGKLKEKKYLEFSDTFKKFVATSKAAGVPVLVFMIPDAAQLNNPPAQAATRFIRQVCENNQVPFLDLTPVFEKELDPNTLYLFPLDAHTSAKGHRLIAETLVGTIRKLNLISPDLQTSEKKSNPVCVRPYTRQFGRYAACDPPALERGL